MTTAVLNRSTHRAPTRDIIALAVGVLLAVWLALVSVLGARGAFAQAPGEPPLPIFVAVALPILLFLAAYSTSAAFRVFVLNLDQRLTLGLQAWRFAGLGFIALTAYNVLPGAFAWPAGLGDIAIGATAPLLAVSLARNGGLVSSRLFVAWNVLGILDLVTAVTTGTLVAWFGLGGDPASMGPMAQLPLLFIPAFLVPIFVVLHIAGLFQARSALFSPSHELAG
jgi:hypothetical protein